MKKGKEAPQSQPAEEFEAANGEESPVEGVRPRGIKYLPVEDAERKEQRGSINRVRVLFSSA